MDRSRKLVENLLAVMEKQDIVTRLYRHKQFPDHPQLVQISCDMKFNQSLTDGLFCPISGHGLSLVNAETSLLKAVAEAAERYCQIIYRDKDITYATYYELVKHNLNALDPRFYNRPDYSPETSLGWVKGYNLTKQQECYIPAQLAYLNYAFRQNEPILLDENTSGAAGGFNKDFVLQRGLAELVERDAFLSIFLTQSQPARIDLDSINDLRVSKIKTLVKRYNLEFNVLNTTTDLGIPCFTSILIDRTGIAPALTLGLKASFNLKEGLVSALEESFMGLAYHRHWFNRAKGKVKAPPKEKIRTISQRTAYWFPLAKMKQLEFLLNGPCQPLSKQKKVINDSEALQKMVAGLKKRNIDVFYADVSAGIFKEIGFLTYKVMVPQLQFLYLNEENKFLQFDRLKQVANYFGQSEIKLNPEPHPFL